MSTKFCPECGTKMQKNTIDDRVAYKCVCQYTLGGAPEDTLMAEGYIGMEDNSTKFAAFITNSAKDHGGLKVKKQCPSCKLPYMTMTRVGTSKVTIYTCTCGHQMNFDDARAVAKTVEPAKK